MLDATKTINGAFVKVHHEGQWMTSANAVEIVSEINFENVPRSGTRKIGKKATTVESTGTLKGLKVNHKLVKAIGQIMDDSKGSFVTELIAEVNDPDAPDAKAHIRVIGVQFSTIPVLNTEHGAVVEEELPFVFDDYEFL